MTMVPSTIVTVRVADGPTVLSSWDAFAWNNRDGLGATLGEIAAALADGRKYIGGGGAMPTWSVERTAAPAMPS